MLVKFTESIIDDFKIPSFEINEGEILILKIPGGTKFQGLVKKICEHIKDKNPTFTYVEHHNSRTFLERIFPLTVRRYLKNSDLNSESIQKIGEAHFLNPDMKFQNLGGTSRRKISLFKTLSYTKNIMIDLVGVDPKGGIEIYGILKENMRNKGSVILFDHFNEFQDDCSKFIEVEYTGMPNGETLLKHEGD
ncbi:hypothetical protein [Flavobacterium silvaticum]|uniref:Uncharacterized protein n=1 Tax=Flavobacterium silvaticum TaxID=1852020 RepID=A0A972FSE8_9FLAO|nr:hypothetical protein [Flavobacterium silvaticum]NMH28504.1 hypothetical protein [Flavobacterium silvaticum]